MGSSDGSCKGSGLRLTKRQWTAERRGPGMNGPIRDDAELITSVGRQALIGAVG